MKIKGLQVFRHLLPPKRKPDFQIRLEVQLEYEHTFRLLQSELKANKAKLRTISALVVQCTTQGIITHEEALNKIEEVLV